MVPLCQRRATSMAVLAVAALLAAARASAEVREDVRDDWEFQYRTMGTPYSERDPKDWNGRVTGVRLLVNDPNAPTEEPYLLDRHAAFWPTDRDQADVVLRRTKALLSHLAAGNPGRGEWQGFSDRLAKLEARFADTKPVEELYDTVADPHEVVNLAAKPEHQETLDRLRKVLEDWMKETKDLGLIPEGELRKQGLPGGHPGTTAEPKIEPNGGTFDKPVTVTLTCATEGASIAYTTDAAKTPHWLLYSTPLVLGKSATLRARACRIGWKDSPEARAVFRF